MDTNFNAILQAIEDCKDLILAAERYIWKNPESVYFNRYAISVCLRQTLI